MDIISKDPADKRAKAEKGENSFCRCCGSSVPAKEGGQKPDLVVTECLSPAVGSKASCCGEPERVLWPDF